MKEASTRLLAAALPAVVVLTGCGGGKTEPAGGSVGGGAKA